MTLEEKIDFQLQCFKVMFDWMSIGGEIDKAVREKIDAVRVQDFPLAIIKRELEKELIEKRLVLGEELFNLRIKMNDNESIHS